MKATSRPRLRGWLGAALAVGLALALVRAIDFGDRGMRNVFSVLLLLASGVAAALVFALRRSVPGSVRLGVLGAGAAVLGLALLVGRIDGFDGELVPQLSWRFGAHAESSPSPLLPSSGAPIRLAPPSPDDSPAFLGPRRDNSVPGLRLARDWAAHPPRLRWKQPIGAGWSAFAVAGSFAFTLEQDERGQCASARSAESGELAWSTLLDQPFAHALGGEGPRSTPTVELDGSGGGRLWACSARGRLACLDATNGALLWDHDLVAEFGSDLAREAELDPYGRSASPLVVGELLIVPAGGDPAHGGAGLAAFDKRTGERRWASPARMYSCSSPLLATLAGVEQVLVLNEASVSGHAPADGELLWEFPWPGKTSADPNVSQPLPFAPGRLLLSKGYGAGGLCLSLERSAGGLLSATELWRAPRLLRTKMTSALVRGDFVYALDDGMLECVELANGARRWKEGRYGHGQLLGVGELLLVCSEEGELVLLEPDPERANAVLGRIQALEGKCWAALAANVLYLRNAEQCAAWEFAVE